MLILKKALPPFCDDQHTRYLQTCTRLERYTTTGLLGFLSQLPWNRMYSTVDSAYIVALYHSAAARADDEDFPPAARKYLEHLKKELKGSVHMSAVFDNVDDQVSERDLWGGPDQPDQPDQHEPDTTISECRGHGESAA